MFLSERPELPMYSQEMFLYKSRITIFLIEWRKLFSSAEHVLEAD